MEDESPELQSLKAFFADLDPVLVESVYKEHECDYKAAMEALAEIAKNPSAAAGRRGHAEGEPRSPLRPPLSSSAPEAGPNSSAPYERDAVSWRNEEPPDSRAASAGAWDFTAMTAALVDWGNNVSDGITGIADNISDFVSDLASAFDAGWDDHQEHGLGPGQGSASDRNRAAVVAGGMEGQRASNRRHPGIAQSNTQTTTAVDWDGENDKKDA